MSTPIALLFCLSGFTGLVYEIIWAKYLALSLGQTALAQTIVLGTFLGGLAAGNALLGPKADESDHPLRLYAKLEIAIGALGLFSPLIMRWSVGVAVMAVSAGLMGGTLPALSRWTTRRLPAMRSTVSLLYGLNSLGAAAGALAAGFMLVPALGLDGAIALNATLNLAIAGAAWWLADNARKKKGPRSVRQQDHLVPDNNERGPLWVIYAAAAIGGFVALGYEVAWIRLLTMVLGSSTYSFSLMLAAFITGIGLGSFAISRDWARSWPAYRLFGLSLLGAGVALAVSLPLYQYLPYVFSQLGGLIPRRPDSFHVYEGFKLLFCAALMLAPTALLGAALPLATRAVTDEVKGIGSRVGYVFALNTLGNVAGAVLTGLFLLPRLGVQGVFQAGIAVNLLLGALVLGLDKGWPPKRRLGAAAVAGVLLACYAGLRPGWDPMPLMFSSGRLRLPLGTAFSTYAKAFDPYRMLFYRDDREMTVAIVLDADEKTSLMLNGKADASTGIDMNTQMLLGHIPLTLAPRPKDVLIVGLGSGVTAGAALHHPIDSLDVVEISPAVAEANRFFHPANGEPFTDPRARLHIDDAKSWLGRGTKKFDVVISEPSNPWIAGIGNLFSADFYKSVERRLNPGGLMAQWFHLYEMDNETFRLVLRTFSSVFKHVTVWHTQINDIVLIGSDSPIEPDFKAFERAFRRSDVSSDLARANITLPASLLALQAATDATVRRWAQDGPVNRDMHPILEYQAPKALFLRRNVDIVRKDEDFAREETRPDLLISRYVQSREWGFTNSEFTEIAKFETAYRPSFMKALGRLWTETVSWERLAPMTWAKACMIMQEYDQARSVLSAWLEKRPNDSIVLDFNATVEVTRFQNAPSPAAAATAIDALKRLERAPGSDKADALARIADVHKQGNNMREALKYQLQAAALAKPNGRQTRDAYWLNAAETALGLEDGKTVLDALEKALAINPDNRDAQDMLEILLRTTSAGVQAPRPQSEPG